MSELLSLNEIISGKIEEALAIFPYEAISTEKKTDATDFYITGIHSKIIRVSKSKENGRSFSSSSDSKEEIKDQVLELPPELGSDQDYISSSTSSAGSSENASQIRSNLTTQNYKSTEKSPIEEEKNFTEDAERLSSKPTKQSETVSFEQSSVSPPTSKSGVQPKKQIDDSQQSCPCKICTLV